MRQVHTGEDCQIAALVPNLLGQACVVTHGKSSNLKLEPISGVQVPQKSSLDKLEHLSRSLIVDN